MVYEGTHGYKTAYSNFLAKDDLNKATVYFCEEFEQAGSPDLEARKREANNVYEYYMMRSWTK